MTMFSVFILFYFIFFRIHFINLVIYSYVKSYVKYSTLLLFSHFTKQFYVSSPHESYLSMSSFSWANF